MALGDVSDCIVVVIVLWVSAGGILYAGGFLEVARCLFLWSDGLVFAVLICFLSFVLVFGRLGCDRRCECST